MFNQCMSNCINQCSVLFYKSIPCPVLHINTMSDCINQYHVQFYKSLSCSCTNQYHITSTNQYQNFTNHCHIISVNCYIQLYRCVLSISADQSHFTNLCYIHFYRWVSCYILQLIDTSTPVNLQISYLSDFKFYRSMTYS